MARLVERYAFSPSASLRVDFERLHTPNDNEIGDGDKSPYYELTERISCKMLCNLRPPAKGW